MNVALFNKGALVSASLIWSLASEEIVLISLKVADNGLLFFATMVKESPYVSYEYRLFSSTSRYLNMLFFNIEKLIKNIDKIVLYTHNFNKSISNRSKNLRDELFLLFLFNKYLWNIQKLRTKYDIIC